MGLCRGQTAGRTSRRLSDPHSALGVGCTPHTPEKVALSGSLGCQNKPECSSPETKLRETPDRLTRILNLSGVVYFKDFFLPLQSVAKNRHQLGRLSMGDLTWSGRRMWSGRRNGMLQSLRVTLNERKGDLPIILIPWRSLPCLTRKNRGSFSVPDAGLGFCANS